MKSLSFLISRVFDFYFWFPVLLFITVFNSGLSSQQLKILLPILLVLEVIVPISLFSLVLAKRKVSDIDVTKRQERHRLFASLTLILFVASLVSFFLGNMLFFILQLISLVSALSMFLITLQFKISGHMLMNTGSIFIINYLFDWKLIWLFLLVPLVGFARIYLKKHTLIEVVTGMILGLGEPYLILKFFKLI